MSKEILLSPELTDEIRRGTIDALYTKTDNLKSVVEIHGEHDAREATQEDVDDIRLAVDDITALGALARELDLPLTTAKGMEFILDRTPQMERAVTLAADHVAQHYRYELSEPDGEGPTAVYRRLLDRIDELGHLVEGLGSEAVTA